MKVYHGSDIKINTIDLSKSKPGKDFGRGFYITKLREQAEEMAKRIANWNHSYPVVTEFEFDEYSFENERFKFLYFKDYTEEWFDFIMLNRKNRSKKQIHNYDIVEGPVADDDVSHGFLEEKAIDFYFNSNTYKQLIDENTGLHKMQWNEVYQILLKELK